MTDTRQKKVSTAPPAGSRGHVAQETLLGAYLTEGRLLFIIIAVTVLVYANSLGGQFLFDDPKQIVNNLQIRSWGNIWHAFSSDVWNFQQGAANSDIPLPYYRPLFTIYLTIGYQLFGLWEPGWHLLNLLVHAGATVMVYYLVRRLQGSLLVAASASLVFGIHPAHVESVSWISGIPDPLAALFYIPAFIWYMRYRAEGEARWLALSVMAYALSVLCKETAIVLPSVLVAWELLRGAERTWPSRLRKAAWLALPFAAVAVGYLFLRVAVLGAISWNHPLMSRVSSSAIWMTIPAVLLSYLQHLTAPFYLSLLYGLPFVNSTADWQFIFPVGLLVVSLMLLWFYRRRIGAEIFVALVLLVAPLLPVLNLRVFHQDYIVQDRYLYLPSIGFCYLAALLLARFARKRQRMATAVAIVCLICFGISAVLQNRIWNNGVALWQRAVAYAPHSWATHYNLGLAYMGRKDYETARGEFLTAAQENPNVPVVYTSLALAQDQLGDENGAVANLQQALALDPKLFEAHNNLGTIFFRRGEYGAAREQFTQVLERDPSSVSMHFNLARVAAMQHDHAAAIPLYESVLAKAPDDSEAHYYLGLSYAAMNRKAAAIEQIQTALGSERGQQRAAEMRASLVQLQNSPQ